MSVHSCWKAEPLQTEVAQALRSALARGTSMDIFSSSRERKVFLVCTSLFFLSLRLTWIHSSGVIFTIVIFFAVSLCSSASIVAPRLKILDFPTNFLPAISAALTSVSITVTQNHCRQSWLCCSDVCSPEVSQYVKS